MNNVSLVGRLTKDIELKYTGSNTAVATGTLAVNRQFKNANGEREADFINIVAWRKTAETIANYTSKGSQIGITGRIQTRSYEGNDGKRVYVTEVVAESFQLLESRASREGQGGNYNSPYQKPAQSTPNFAREENPFGANNPMDISDDDLPF